MMDKIKVAKELLAVARELTARKKLRFDGNGEPYFKDITKEVEKAMIDFLEKMNATIVVHYVYADWFGRRNYNVTDFKSTFENFKKVPLEKFFEYLLKKYVDVPPGYGVDDLMTRDSLRAFVKDINLDIWAEIPVKAASGAYREIAWWEGSAQFGDMYDKREDIDDLEGKGDVNIEVSIRGGNLTFKPEDVYQEGIAEIVMGDN